MARAEIILKRKQNNGDTHCVEIFFIKGGIVIHRHVLTDDDKTATAFKKYRKFWNKWYTMQEVVIILPEIKSILKGILLHPIKVFMMFRILK